jgi:hypothetical protein
MAPDDRRGNRMDTIAELLTVVEELPPARREEARARIAEAIAAPAPAARAALGVLALDLVDLTVDLTADVTADLTA